MSESNGFPEWLRELGAKVDQLAEHGKQTDARLNALAITVKHQHAILDGILKALDQQVKDIDKLVAITSAHEKRIEKLEGNQPQ